MGEGTDTARGNQISALIYSATHWVMRECGLVYLCPEGRVEGCMDLRNRGLDLVTEVTAWPRNKHHRLMTGKSYMTIEAPKLNNIERQMCAILGLDELDLGIFLKSWAPGSFKTEREIKRALSFYGRIEREDRKTHWNRKKLPSEAGKKSYRLRSERKLTKQSE